MAGIATLLGRAVTSPLVLIARVLDPVLRLWQRRTGTGGMIALFLLPNMAVFGVFVIIPLILNFAYSLTGGAEILLGDRRYVGPEQYGRLLDCRNYLEPLSCREDQFWTAVRNTTIFVTFQVSLMVTVSMITALILNRNIAGRGFFRAVFFFPVLLSPVVVGLIWRWILQRDGLLNLIVTTFGGNPVCCASALATLEVLQEEKLIEQVEAKGKLFEKYLTHSSIKEIRRVGLFFAIDFESEEKVKRIVKNALEMGAVCFWFLSCPNSFRIAPPLTITEDEIKHSCEILLAAIEQS